MIIEVGHEKGGVGKSTLAINLAAYLSRQSRGGRSKECYRVVLVDTDESGSTSRWGELRTSMGLEHHFAIVDKAIDPTAHILKLSEAYDIVVVDVGAGDYARLSDMSRIVDLWIAPTGVGQKEGDSNVNLIEAFEKANQKHKNGKIPLVVAFNKVPSSANSTEAALAAEALQEFAPSLNILQSKICDRKVWRDADREGKSIFEMPARAREKAEREFTEMVEQAFKAYEKFVKEGRAHGNN
jgi:chromosome partitioning protein